MQIVGGALLPYRITYHTNNVITMTLNAAMSGTVNGNLAPVPFILNTMHPDAKYARVVCSPSARADPDSAEYHDGFVCRIRLADRLD